MAPGRRLCWIVLLTVCVATTSIGVCRGQAIRGTVLDLEGKALTGFDIEVRATVVQGGRRAIATYFGNYTSTSGAYAVNIPPPSTAQSLQVNLSFRERNNLRLPALLVGVALKAQTIDVTMPENKRKCSCRCWKCRRRR